MPTEIILPRVDMDMASGKISKWYFKDGDAIEKGALLFDLETSKAAMEIEASASGTLRVVNGAIGEDIPVGQVLGWIYAAGEKVEGASTAKPTGAASAPAPVKTSADETHVSPRTNGVANGLRATPLARRLARERGIELTSLTGSGPNGRINRADLENAQPAPKPPAAVTSLAIPAAPVAMADDRVFALYEPDSYDMAPHDSMRKTIAKRLVESKATVPHFYLTIDCNLENLLAARQELNARAPKEGRGAYKLSVNDFVIKALAVALRDVPLANATWTSQGMMRHKRVDVGVAVAVEGGLLTPILRHADLKSLSELSNEMKDLAARARAKKLAPREYQGGTTSISNLGMFGIRQFDAVINPPQATILAVGAAEDRSIVVNRKQEVATMMTCTLSCDHRVVDGAIGAALLNAFKAYLESPVRMLV